MFIRRNLMFGKRKYLYVLIVLSIFSLICVAFIITSSDDFDIARREILLRRIGHEILVQAGDSTSQVLPVKKISENEYQISFKNAFTFQPDLLVNTTRRLLAKDPLASDYVVNVLNCADALVIYGYAISKYTKDDIIACIGRIQPIGCYMINIKFKPTAIITAMNKYLLGALAFLTCIGFIFMKSVKPQKNIPDSPPTNVFTLGSLFLT